MTRPFYMRLNWADYHRDTYGVLTTAAQHGAYLLLLGALFDAGGRLKADDGRLAAKACCTGPEWAGLKPTLMPFFKVTRGWLSQKRVSEELANISVGRAKRSQSGALGGKASGESRRRAKALAQAHASGGEAPASKTEANRTKLESESKLQSPKAKALGSRRCPADWAPPPEIVTMALGQPDLGGLAMSATEYDRELAKFRDYEFPKPRKDWSATFRNWLRHAAEWKARDEHRSGPAAKLAERHANYAAAQRGADLAAGRAGQP